MNRLVDIASSFAVSVARLGLGMEASNIGPRPEKVLELYEFEACPFCRKVREALTALDLDVMVYPCPKDGKRFRPKVKKLGGHEMFPYLIDPNTDRAMYESDDIVAYLFRHYGRGSQPILSGLGPVNTASSFLASAYRPSMGRALIPSKAPAKPLELWSFEASPYCRIVREALTSLEIPYLLHNVGKGSPKRDEFVKRSGKMMVPYLADPNTGREMFESAEIVDYLMTTYAKGR